MFNLSFKNKIVALIVAAISITILVSYFSVNHFISGYIFQSDSKNITHNIHLLRDKLNTELNSKLSLANSLSFSMMDISDTKKKSGFDKIVKVLIGYAFDDEGTMEDKVAAPYLAAAKDHPDGMTISPVTEHNGVQTLTFSIKRADKSVDFFVLNLKDIVKIIHEYSMEGSYAELRAGNHIIFSNKSGDQQDLIPIQKDIKFGGQQWQLTGYIDPSNIQSNTNKLNGMITLALLICAVLVIGFSVSTVHFAMKPLMRLNTLVGSLSQGNGDLTQRLAVETNNEIGQISHSINLFIEKLQSMFIEVSASSTEIDTAIQTLNHQSHTNAQTLDRHTIESEQAITAIEELSASAASVEHSARDTASLTEKTNQYAETSKNTVSNAVQSVNDLINQVTSMSETIGTMNSDTQQISSVLEVIGEIAEQTNLLALNAAIEAARAGEQGRGFAVVADEVRALAVRTQQSTSQINEMLSKLKSTADNVATEMKSTRDRCEHTADHTNKVMDSLNVVTDSVREINDLNALMSTSAQEQRHVAEEVSRNMTEIQGMIKQLNENATQTMSVSHELKETSQDLSAVVNRFRVR
ncbi:methyl-accepting chemotaxis protein [Vibrio sp. PP-XX7]